MIHTIPAFLRRAGLLAAVCSLAAFAPAENIILLIGDGMGPEQVKAAAFHAHGEEGSLSFDQLPVKGWSRTDPAIDSPTDSAAGGTALSTGVKVKNGVLSLDIPGDGQPLETILERAQKKGWSTGLVSTAYLTHATPAAFAAHIDSRGGYDAIGQQMLTQTRPDVLLGGGHSSITPAMATQAGYQVVTDRAGLMAVAPAKGVRLAGLFGDGYMPYEHDGVGDLPHLTDMTTVALNALATNPAGFFLMVEGGRIDHAGHANELERNIGETEEFARAVQAVMDWAKDRKDTLVIITADHETGGLTVLKNNGKGQWPDVKWSTKNHSAVNVPIYAWGPGSKTLGETVDNTAIHGVMVEFLESAKAPAAVQ